MLYQITHLKAPWPAGAKVGDIVDLPTLPAWALGKCRTAADAKAATVEFPEPEPVRDLAADLEALEADLADARIKQANAEQRADAAAAEAEQLRAKVAELEAAAAKPPKPTKG